MGTFDFFCTVFYQLFKKELLSFVLKIIIHIPYFSFIFSHVLSFVLKNDIVFVLLNDPFCLDNVRFFLKDTLFQEKFCSLFKIVFV